ncbi:hypothetical protein CBW54_09400 [Yersinia kristensenii]|nr:hypothetical protein CBW54_09400 [Yersinia kristensenii]
MKETAQQVMLNLENLALEEDLIQGLLPPKGLVLIGGLTGSGRTTLQSAIYQHYVRLYPDDSFAEGLPLSLRQSPQVVNAEEIRDTANVTNIMTCVQTGHSCLTSVHTPSVGQAISRLLLLFPLERCDALALDLLTMLQAIVVPQRTLQGTQFIYEYLIFDEEIRLRLSSLNWTLWRSWIDNELLGRKIAKAGRHQRIAPAPVKRDTHGYWIHPVLKHNGPQTRAEFSHWRHLQGLQSWEKFMRDDAPGIFWAGLNERKWNTADWNPQPPPDEGWFIGSIQDDEDGPVCLWLKVI